MQLRCTALDSRAILRKTVSDAVLDAIKHQPSILDMVVNVPSDYASEWYSFQFALQKGNSAVSNMMGVSGMLPFWTQRVKVTVDCISLIIFPKPSSTLCTEKMQYPGITLECQGLDAAADCEVLVGENINKNMAPDWR